MKQRFPIWRSFAQKSEKKFLAEHGSTLKGNNLINTPNLCGIDVLTCVNVSKHKDEQFGWVALWVLLSYGHIFCCQEKLRIPVNTRALLPGRVIVFDSRNHWHWTERGNGLLVVMPHDFERQPTALEVQQAFDEKLTAAKVSA